MHRFFLEREHWTPGGEIDFQAETARQMERVLRLKPGQRVIVLDNAGMQAEVELTNLSAQEGRGRVIKELPATAEPSCRLTMYLCLSQREKFEWMLQKCTEVGAAAFVPVVSERSLVQALPQVEKKADRWNRILQEAAEQCGRGLIPKLEAPLQFGQAVQAAAQADDVCLIPWEGTQGNGVRDALQPLKQVNGECRVGVLIGPEGGFSSCEVDIASSAGFHPVTLGSRILRMETAAVVAAALVLYELGEMG